MQSQRGGRVFGLGGQPPVPRTPLVRSAGGLGTEPHGAGFPCCVLASEWDKVKGSPMQTCCVVHLAFSQKRKQTNENLKPNCRSFLALGEFTSGAEFLTDLKTRFGSTEHAFLLQNVWRLAELRGAAFGTGGAVTHLIPA